MSTIYDITRTMGVTRGRQARQYVADQLHLDYKDIDAVVAVAYIQRHFEMGDYSAWDGWVEMIEADEASERRYRERTS